MLIETWLAPNHIAVTSYERYGVSNNRRLDYLLNRLLRSRWMKTSKLPLCGKFTGHRWIPHTKGQSRGKFDDVIMQVMIRCTDDYVDVIGRMLMRIHSFIHSFIHSINQSFMSIHEKRMNKLHYIKLTHLPLMPHIYVSESGQHWFG